MFGIGMHFLQLDIGGALPVAPPTLETALNALAIRIGVTKIAVLAFAGGVLLFGYGIRCGISMKRLKKRGITGR